MLINRAFEQPTATYIHTHTPIQLEIKILLHIQIEIVRQTCLLTAIVAINVIDVDRKQQARQAGS